MSARRPRNATRATRQGIELALAVPVVVTHRMSRLVTAGPTPSARDRREFERMSAEKVAAFCESWNAMWMAASSAYLRAWFSWTPWTPFTFNASHRSRQRKAALGVLTAGLAPVHRRAVANARRLGRIRADALR
ncbi:MAG TPA: polyhydroxyalkanoate granule-associated phasin [Casimicrobiaceae bacterium]|nr:polyhydroxyalkanoate granule-associated phasin [Casimicrobiaceae bacterium]